MRGIDGIAPASSRAMCAIALLNCALLVTTSSKVSAQLRPGDILLNNFGGSNIQVYDGSGQLRQTITGTGGLWECLLHRRWPLGPNGMLRSWGAESHLQIGKPDRGLHGGVKNGGNRRYQ